MKESKIFTERNLAEKVHYVYRVTIDEKYYIGKRSGSLNDLETGRYKTSSKIIEEKLRNGCHFSKIKILQVFYASEEALEYEKKILTRLNAKRNPKFLNQTNGGDGDFTFKQHTEKSKKKMSKSHKEFYKTERGVRNKEIHSEFMKEFYKTERGVKNREINSEFMKEYFNPETERGVKNREIHSKSHKEFYKTERGVKNREINSKSHKEFYKTERGVRNKEIHSEFMKEFYNTETEEGRKNRERARERQKERFNINTEEGRKYRENMSKGQKRRFNPNTESGRLQLEENRRKAKVGAQKSAEASFQKKKNSSILKELIFDEDFIKENFLIIDDKNNQRFLSSVYSKLSGYCESNICKQKRNGKLSFLYGIKSISITEELENSKIKEIEAIIKSANKKKNK